MQAPPRILRIRDVRERTGLATSSVYDLVKRGHFPRPVRISARSVGWPENEISEFIADRIAKRNAKRNDAWQQLSDAAARVVDKVRP